MEHSSSSKPMVIEYKKRRFDGGAEKELIEHIENQYRIQQQQLWNEHVQKQLAGNQNHVEPSISNQPVIDKIDSAVEKPVKSKHKKNKILKMLFSPYIELIWGLSGLIVAGIVWLTLKNNLASSSFNHAWAALIDQSKQLIVKSISGIFSSPWVALKSCFS